MGVYLCNTRRAGADVYDWRDVVMIYDGSPHSKSDGQWHCPFSLEWVERMRRAAKHCERLSAEYIARRISNDEYIYHVPDGDFIIGPQGRRVIPLHYISRLPVKCDVYDYSTIPDVVVTNGRDDWPLCTRGLVLMA